MEVTFSKSNLIEMILVSAFFFFIVKGVAFYISPPFPSILPLSSLEAWETNTWQSIKHT